MHMSLKAIETNQFYFRKSKITLVELRLENEGKQQPVCDMYR